MMHYFRPAYGKAMCLSQSSVKVCTPFHSACLSVCARKFSTLSFAFFHVVSGSIFHAKNLDFLPRFHYELPKLAKFSFCADFIFHLKQQLCNNTTVYHNS